MYHLRLKIYIILCIAGLLVAVGRLVTLQTFYRGKAQKEIKELRIMNPEERPTLRGKILDRYGTPLAQDRPVFYLHINYKMTRYMDRRWREGRILRKIDDDTTRAEAEYELYQKEWKEPMENLEQTIDLAWQVADVSREEIEANIKEVNDFIWELARWLWWKNRNPELPRSEYLAIRDKISPKILVGENIREMHETYPLVELKTQRDLVHAQKELLELSHLSIKSEPKRYYPFNNTACRLVGWVAPFREYEAELFRDDKYMSYKPGETVGKFGLEKVYEPVLRGRRGEVRYDVEGNLVERKEARYGRDVQLTIDIDLQQKVEQTLADNAMPHGNKYCAAVVLDVAGNDILAMASMPTFDLNTIRKEENYDLIFDLEDPNKLWEHKALERNYPPGSTAKPLILVAGMEEKKISSGTVIECTNTPPPRSWPGCIAEWKFHNPHSSKWAGEGGNNARNAIRGSCNIYFSRVADRLDARDLQKWLFTFGYGKNILPTPQPDDLSEAEVEGRHLLQACGNIIFGVQKKPYTNFEQVPPIPPSKMSEKRYWGIGQGNLRVTVLQVANALSSIVRGGVYKPPQLIKAIGEEPVESEQHSLGISQNTINTVRDGMWAVVNETGGTAYNVLKESDLRTGRDMKIYGKTGSTQNPSVAWFECFAEDRTGRAVVIAVLVERGQSGSGEAAPLGKRILELVNRAGYVGKEPVE